MVSLRVVSNAVADAIMEEESSNARVKKMFIVVLEKRNDSGYW
jgi:hypothetical protein